MSNDIFSLGDPTYDAVYAEEAAKIDAAERIAGALERSGMSRAELARALGVSRAEITRRLKGEHNIGVATLAATLHVLGESLELNPAAGSNVTRPRETDWRLPRTSRHRAAARSSVWARESEAQNV
ncbi:transcriptional regulator with XRE-family HTH domain [Leucobacter exalbidus]|uniref:Transcriptional regulator with XRE-family HTH domain n=1 Tax=Leucobacter exalbidus TaxID=662960 RepID=A0A940T5U7_9MICO|nr:helix-turn-helix transcriptional regulator [Leucobacter exalbidus]MBP1326326.1 transcriptional regulator with XRE-family HTH domain [Leucobacter exalbidus]